MKADLIEIRTDFTVNRNAVEVLVIVPGKDFDKKDETKRWALNLRMRNKESWFWDCMTRAEAQAEYARVRNLLFSDKSALLECLAPYVRDTDQVKTVADRTAFFRNVRDRIDFETD